MTKGKTFIAAFILALASIFASAIPASATTGGSIYNTCSSNGSIYITAQHPMQSYTSLPRCTASYNFGMSNVQGFKVGAGWQLKNVNTGYIYSSNVWHYMCCNNVHINFLVTWVG